MKEGDTKKKCGLIKKYGGCCKKRDQTQDSQNVCMSDRDNSMKQPGWGLMEFDGTRQPISWFTAGP